MSKRDSALLSILRREIASAHRLYLQDGSAGVLNGNRLAGVPAGVPIHDGSLHPSRGSAEGRQKLVETLLHRSADAWPTPEALYDWLASLK